MRNNSTTPRAKSDLNPKDTTTPRAIIIVFKNVVKIKGLICSNKGTIVTWPDKNHKTLHQHLS